MTADLIATHWRYLIRTRRIMPWRCRVDQMIHRSGRLGHVLTRADAERLLLFIGCPLKVLPMPRMQWLSAWPEEPVFRTSLVEMLAPIWNRRQVIMRLRSS